MSNTYIVGEQTKRTIIKESRKLFYKYGFEETTYNDISDAAGINRALIPYHFKTKQVLGQIILEQITTDFLERLDSAVDIEQYIPEFVYILHEMATCRLLSNEKYCRFSMQLQEDNSYTQAVLEKKKSSLKKLSAKTSKIDDNTLYHLASMVIGMERECTRIMSEADKKTNPDNISAISLHMILDYVGYSKKKVDELIEIAVEVLDSYSIRVKNGFSIEIKEI